MMTNTEKLDDIDKQIEQLYAKRAKVESQIEKERKEAETAKKQERDDALLAIKESIKLFNETYNESLVLGFTDVKRGVGDEIWRQLFYGTPFEDAFRNTK